jgi:hypothetical protein
MTDDVLAFFTVRLDEHERLARAAISHVKDPMWVGSQASGHPWRYERPGVWGDKKEFGRPVLMGRERAGAGGGDRIAGPGATAEATAEALAEATEGKHA